MTQYKKIGIEIPQNPAPTTTESNPIAWIIGAVILMKLLGGK